MEGFLETARPLDFNYGEKQGDERFRSSLALFLGRAHGKPVSAQELFLTNGNSQALDFVCDRFTRPGDTVYVEEPSYFLAFQVFRDHGLNIVGIPVDQDGMQIDILEKALRRSPPALVYTIPSFNNPSGLTLSRERRERLADLSTEHGFVVAADEVYQMLSYFDEVPPAMGTMVDRGRVLSMGSFSKILAPGLRLGWIQANSELMENMLDSGWVNSGGSVNHVTSHIVRYAIDSGLQEQHLEAVRKAYRNRLVAMGDALSEHFDDLARWTQPAGGYFYWLEMSNGTEAVELRSVALEAGAGLMPGPFFSGSGGLRNFVRLSFAHYTEADIREGVSRLADAFRQSVPGPGP